MIVLIIDNELLLDHLFVHVDAIHTKQRHCLPLSLPSFIKCHSRYAKDVNYFRVNVLH